MSTRPLSSQISSDCSSPLQQPVPQKKSKRAFSLLQEYDENLNPFLRTPVFQIADPFFPKASPSASPLSKRSCLLTPETLMSEDLTPEDDEPYQISSLDRAFSAIFSFKPIEKEPFEQSPQIASPPHTPFQNPQSACPEEPSRTLLRTPPNRPAACIYINLKDMSSFSFLDGIAEKLEPLHLLIEQQPDFVNLLDALGVPYHLVRLPSGKIVAAIRQPPLIKTSCGLGAIAMVMSATDTSSLTTKKTQQITHFFASRTFTETGLTDHAAIKKIILDFFPNTPVTTKYLYNQSDLENTKTEEEYIYLKSILQKVDISEGVATKQKIIESLKNTLQTTQHPIILGITHPELAGHWIVLDEWNNGFFYIRDPFSGFAWKIPEQELAKMILNDVFTEELLYFP